MSPYKNINIIIPVLVFTLFFSIVVLVLVLKSKNKKELYSSDINLNTTDCKVAKSMDFPDIHAQPCAFSAKNNTTAYKPAYIIFLRHCDRGYSDEPHEPNPPPGYPKRTTCKTDDSNICEGCMYLESEGGCASNDCSTKGIYRSWALGKWINCFANDKQKEVAGIIAQEFVGGESNKRPTTTATIIYESLTVNFSKSPCYMYARKSKYEIVKSYLQKEIFNNQIVVIVWSHGQLGDLINHVTGISSGIYWDNCCFDKVAVMDYNNNEIKVYNTKSLEDNDLCGVNTCNAKDTYKTTNGLECSFSNFGNQTPCSITCSNDNQCDEGYKCNQQTQTCVKSDDCYNNDENPFELLCTKSACCDGKLRLHNSDPPNQPNPYYICSTDESLRTDKPPKCDPANTPESCLKSSFCPPQKSGVNDFS